MHGYECLLGGTHDADARDGILALGSFAQHDVCFVLGEVELGLLGCWVGHVGRRDAQLIAEPWLAMGVPVSS